MANLRVRIDDGFETFGRWLYRNRFKTLLMMLVVVAAFGSQLPRLTFDTSNESYFHEEDPTLREYDAFREQFGREEMLIIALRPPEVFDRAFLQWLADFHAALEDEVPYVKEITSLVNVRNTRGEGDELIVEDLLETLPRTPSGNGAAERAGLVFGALPQLSRLGGWKVHDGGDRNPGLLARRRGG